MIHVLVATTVIEVGVDVPNASLKVAKKAMLRLVADVGLWGANAILDSSKSKRGRFMFEVERKGRSVIVLIPGDEVISRYRLYVDGSSWERRFAVEVIRDALKRNPA